MFDNVWERLLDFFVALILPEKINRAVCRDTKGLNGMVLNTREDAIFLMKTSFLTFDLHFEWFVRKIEKIIFCISFKEI